MTAYTCVGLLAREHGLAVARFLADSPEHRLVALFTHRLNPKSEDPQRGDRSTFAAFADLARLRGIPFYTVDAKAEHEVLTQVLSSSPADFLISVSWRYILPEEILALPRVGAINVHRGDLPAYAGAEPIKQAINNRESTIAVCAHRMIAECDAGPILARRTYPVQYDVTQSLNDNVERLKKEITPCFPELIEESIGRYPRSWRE